MPTKFTISNDRGNAAVFELTSSGYAWQSLVDPTLSGVQQIPGLDEALTWKIRQDTGGFFEADVPLESFGGSVREHFKDAGSTTLTAFGAFDPDAKVASIAAVDPAGVIADVTVDFTAIDGEIELVGAWSQSTDSDKGIIIVIPIATVLAILGLAAIACVLMNSYCFLACSLTCTWGVKRVVSSICGVSCTCECNDPPLGCGATTPTEINTLSLDDGSPTVQFPKSASTTLTRLESSDELHHGKPISYLMGEWAVFSSGGGDPLRILRASSTDFAQGKVDPLEQSLKAAPQLEPSTTLVVEYPLHPDNERKIDMPDLVLRPTLAPSGLADGRVMVRADFQHRHLARLDLLASTVEVPPVVTSWLQSSLDLEFHSDKNHRVVTFAVLEIDNGTLKVVETLQYLPKCCCLAPPC
ncbi:MAG: hypothetical protein AAGC60_07715 [Acidobacteriota bacterium]